VDDTYKCSTRDCENRLKRDGASRPTFCEGCLAKRRAENDAARAHGQEWREEECITEGCTNKRMNKQNRLCAACTKLKYKGEGNVAEEKATTCKVEGCEEPPLEHRAVCRGHWNEMQKEARKAKAGAAPTAKKASKPAKKAEHHKEPAPLPVKEEATPPAKAAAVDENMQRPPIEAPLEEVHVAPEFGFTVGELADIVRLGETGGTRQQLEDRVVGFLIGAGKL
jgi:hypothetical protein